ncbi:hypothetical protein PUN28_011758 [Cardiocondyla obscurior]|uniref:Histone H3 n=1 Tax=Cardiocondyla obscurior TaxID=286306 RepID=A0AAW2FGV1_9HYME
MVAQGGQCRRGEQLPRDGVRRAARVPVCRRCSYVVKGGGKTERVADDGDSEETTAETRTTTARRTATTTTTSGVGPTDKPLRSPGTQCPGFRSRKQPPTQLVNSP